MSIVSLLKVDIQDNPAPFTKPFAFEISFECLEPLTKDLEWKLTYVGSATSSEHDQELDTLLVGPVPVGVNKFLLTADAPNPARIPSSELLGVTVLLLTCSYDTREFIRVGYYVNNEYDNEEMNAEPPKTVQIDRVVRNLLTDKPRVTRFAIKWDSEESAPAEYPPDQPEADLQEADGDQYGAEETDVEAEELEEEGGAAVVAPADSDAMEEDTEMGGAQEGKEVEDDEEGSEDLEESSEDDEDELEEDDGVEGAEDDEMALDDGAAGAPAPGGAGQVAHPPAPETMAH